MDDPAYPFSDKTFKRDITTSSEQCQKFFNIGLILAYAFNHEEATMCFQKCLEYDPSCAMAHWGVAFCQGINYNNTSIDEEKSLYLVQSSSLTLLVKLGYDSIQKALTTSENVTSVEKALIVALSQRYIWPCPPDVDTHALEERYSTAMSEVCLN